MSLILFREISADLFSRWWTSSAHLNIFALYSIEITTEFENEKVSVVVKIGRGKITQEENEKFEEGIEMMDLVWEKISQVLITIHIQSK